MPRKCIVIEYPNSGTLANILDRIGKRDTTVQRSGSEHRDRAGTGQQQGQQGQAQQRESVASLVSSA
jgi:hypothetical protein